MLALYLTQKHIFSWVVYMKRNILGDSIEIPSGACGKNAKIEIHSNKMAVVDGCMGVIEYTPEVVTLNCGNGSIMFLGKNFIISSYLDRGLVLEGTILSIEFNM